MEIETWTKVRTRMNQRAPRELNPRVLNRDVMKVRDMLGAVAERCARKNFAYRSRAV